MKKLLALLLSCLSILSLAACGGGTDTPSESGDDAGAESAEAVQTVGYVSASWSDDYCKRLNDALLTFISDRIARICR